MFYRLEVKIILHLSNCIKKFINFQYFLIPKKNTNFHFDFNKIVIFLHIILLKIVGTFLIRQIEDIAIPYCNK